MFKWEECDSAELNLLNDNQIFVPIYLNNTR